MNQKLGCNSLKMYTRSGAYPPGIKTNLESDSHKWILKNFSSLNSNLKLEYKSLTEEDIPEIRSLHKEWFPVSYSENFFEEIGGSLSSVAAVINPKDYGDYSTNHSVICGSILFKITDQKNPKFHNTCYISTFGVVEALRGKGIAKELILECKRVCRSYSVSQMSLNVITYNTQAIKFYEKIGFTKSRTKSNHYLIEGETFDAFEYVYSLRRQSNISFFLKSFLPKYIKSIFNA
uniref:N-alpha-acetyltransferase 60 n=1 Tax=Fabrea salina TaxID=342563 RepID=A0A7S3MPU5_9CILI|mmetsp:Transcript_1582/g.2558  ORF Transcript_1582/g.2558 Transcript_1582/m.2558 type:complete len:234 (+) Transcript_1582:63-764(+)